MENRKPDFLIPFDVISAPVFLNCASWFYKNKHEICFDIDFEKAIAYKLFKDRKCPMRGEWAAFVFSGSIVFALTERLIIPRPGTPFNYYDLETHIWEALWFGSEENFKVRMLDLEFLAASLRSLYPRRYTDAINNRSFRMSNFCSIWRSYVYSGDSERIGYICSSVLEQGKEFFENLPSNFKNGINKISNYSPKLLEIVMNHIKNY